MPRHALIMALVLLASAAAAQDTAVPLPLLQGSYDEGFVLPNDQPAGRTCTFTIPPEVQRIDTMRLVTSGTGTGGHYITERDLGGGVVVRDTIPYPCRMRLLLSAETLDGAHLLSVVGLAEEGVVDHVSDLVHSEDAALLDFDLLRNTTVQAEFVCSAGLAYPRWVDALAEVTDVHLSIEGPVVPAGRRTWSDVKALYR